MGLFIDIITYEKVLNNMIESRLALLKNLTLLLVEDDEKLLKNLKTTLSLFFKNIITSNNGSSALKLYEKNCVDVIITDYVMPIMSGYELCVAIREKNKKIPMIIISNHTDQDKLLKSISLNLSEYLVKPLEYPTLTKALLKIILKMEENNSLIEYISPSMKYNIITKELYNNEEKMFLTKSEIAALEFFVKNKNQLISSDKISIAIETGGNKSEQAIKNIIYRLRKKLGKDIIENVQGLGYILNLK